MIHFRLREPGDDDWTIITVDGELETEINDRIAHLICTARYHVQRQGEDGEWETINE